jgi:hypothetical protein
MISVFINYRQRDAACEAGRIASDIKARFGAPAFMDSSILAGEPWPDRIQQKLHDSSVIIIVIGPGWLTDCDPDGKRRLDQDEDWVRLEIATALEATNKTVIPVLVRDAQLPSRGALPEPLHDLVLRQALPLRHHHWDRDIQLLFERIDPSTPSKKLPGEVDLSAPNLPADPEPKPVEKPSILYPAFGMIHSRWMRYPRRATICAAGAFLIIAITSLFLGIGRPFQANDETIDGILSAPNWGPLFLFATPIAANLMGWYFRALDNALLSLDHILKPVNPEWPTFSAFLTDRLRYAWPTWIFPVCVFLPIFLTIVADGRDIIAPMRSPVIPPSQEKDWSTLGYLAYTDRSPLYYLAFNIVAFGLQVFVAYCGFLLLVLTAYMLNLSINFGIAGRELRELFVHPDAARTFQFRTQWDFRGQKGRCGLHQLDSVFFLYVALNLVCLVVAGVSVFINEGWKGGADLGSFILIGGTILWFPVSVYWIVYHYWSRFPSEAEIPAALKGKVPKPTPWPWASAWVTWFVVILAGALWGGITSYAIWKVL